MYFKARLQGVDLKRGQLRKEVKMAATTRILKKLSLSHLTELFHRSSQGNNTLDINSMLGTHQINQLGITSRVDMTSHVGKFWFTLCDTSNLRSGVPYIFCQAERYAQGGLAARPGTEFL